MSDEPPFKLGTIAPPRASDTAPEFMDLMGASMRGNGLTSILRAAQTQNFPRDPDFSLSEYFTQRPDLMAYQDRFEDVQSNAEAQAKEVQINQELKDRQTREAAGFSGIVTDIASSFTSPDMFMPIGVAGRGLKAAGRIALAGAGQATVHEGLMQATQETRTAEESMAGIFGAAVIGGVLGAAVGELSGREFKAAAKKVLDDPSFIHIPRPESPALDRQSIGAKRTPGSAPIDTDPGQLLRVLSPEELGSATFRQRATDLARKAMGLDSVLTPEQVGSASITARIYSKGWRIGAYPSPVARNLLSKYPKIRGLQAQLADGGLYFNEGVLSAAGGPIENRVDRLVKTYETATLRNLDKHYNEYYFGRPAKGLGERMQAEVGGLVPLGGRLTRRQFSEQVFIEAQEPSSGAIPQVKAAAQDVKADLYHPIFKEMQAVGLVSPDMSEEDFIGQLAYINHVFQRDSVIKNFKQFKQMIVDSYQSQFTREYGERVKRLKDETAATERDIADMTLPEDKMSEARAEVQRELAVLRESEAMTIQDSIRIAKRELRDLEDKLTLGGPRSESDTQPIPIIRNIEGLKARIKQLEGSLKPEDVGKVERAKALRKRLQVLNGSAAALTKRQQRVFDVIEGKDEEALLVLRKVAGKIDRFNKDLASLSPEAFDKAKTELGDEITKAKARLDKLDKKTDELEADLNFREAAGEGDVRLFNQDSASIGRRRMETTKRLNEMQDVLDSLDPETAPGILKEWQDDVITETSERLRRIAERRAALVERAKALDPGKVAKQVEDMRIASAEKKFTLHSWVQAHGGEMIGDTPDFTGKEGGQKFANEVYQSVVGNPAAVHGLELLNSKGAEFARVLNIPLSKKMHFLETDMDRLVRIYTRSVIPGIELTRSGFGVNGAKALDEVVSVYEKARNDLTELTAEGLPGGGPRQKAGEGDAEFAVRQQQAVGKFVQKEAVRLEKEKNAVFRAFVGQFERLRHQRAIPDNPDSWIYRGARMLSQWNVLTMLGNVAPTQLTDPALAVMKLGVRRLGRHALKPLITDFKNARISQREALYMGLDELQNQSRLYQMSDMLEDAGLRRSKGEQAVEFASNKMGIVAGFTPMNQAVRQFLIPAVTGKLFDSIEIVMTGKAAYGVSVRKAAQNLVEAQLDGDMIQRIWAERENGGIVNHNGLWIPNTETWQDVGAREAYRQAAHDSMMGIIISPGLERPLFVDKNIGFKLLTQFQSFMWSSHTKVLMAGLQKRDADVAMAFLSGIPLAALAYYVVKVSKGEGEEALNQSPEIWMDEIVARHPMTGALMLPLKIGQEVPATRPYLQFSDRGSERRHNADIIGAIGGPSLTTAKRATKVLAEINDPTQSTIGTVKTLTWYNQVFYANWLFTRIADEGKKGLPKQHEKN